VTQQKLLRNIAGSWLGIGTDAIVGFLLTRFILHAVGDASFGLWVLLSGLLGYYGLLDLGTRNAVLRYVARYNAQDDHEGLSRVLSTALATYALAGCIVLVAAGAVALWLDSVFIIQTARELSEGRQLLLVLAFGAAVGFPLSAFSGALEGMQQFVRVGVVQATATIARALVIVAFVRLGYGIVAIGVITVFFNLAAGIANAVYVARRYRLIRFTRSNIRKDTLLMLGGFGIVTFWIGIANRLRFESDALVVGSVLGLELVALLSIATKIMTYSTEFVATMSGVFTPLVTHAHAVGDKQLVREATQRGNYYASLVSFPFAACLLFFGKLIIQLWVGDRYHASYSIIAILVVPMTLYVSQGGTTGMIYAVGMHRRLAKILFAEGLANVGLSIVLAHAFGLLGVAWGTAIPLAITGLVALPWCGCQALEISLIEYWRGHAKALLKVTPIVALWSLFTWLLPTAGIPLSLTALVAGGLLYVAITYHDLVLSRRSASAGTRAAVLT
jgi:O-antigen/teichoic acid export membrane protein